jgi:hypothetical protein
MRVSTLSNKIGFSCFCFLTAEIGVGAGDFFHTLCLWKSAEIATIETQELFDNTLFGSSANQFEWELELKEWFVEEAWGQVNPQKSFWGELFENRSWRNVPLEFSDASALPSFPPVRSRERSSKFQLNELCLDPLAAPLSSRTSPNKANKKLQKRSISIGKVVNSLSPVSVVRAWDLASEKIS